MSVVVRTSFCKESMGSNCKPGFAEESDEAFPVFVGDLCCFESTEKITILLGIIIALIERLLGNN